MLTHHEVSVETRACSLHIPSVIPMRTVACVSIGGVSLKSLINHSLDGFWSHVVWVGIVRRALPSDPGCLALLRCPSSANNSACSHNALASCLSSHRESLLFVPDSYGQSLEALSSQPAASESESHVPSVVSE
ncbi:hypothetical protein Tco_0039749 [Tanacetum coccineum]